MSIESPLKPFSIGSSTSGTTNDNSFLSSHSSSNHSSSHQSTQQVMQQGFQFSQPKISHQQLVQQAPINAQTTTTPTISNNHNSNSPLNINSSNPTFYADSSDPNYVQKMIQSSIMAYEVILPIINEDSGDLVYESAHNIYANSSFNNFNAHYNNSVLVYVKSRKLNCLKTTFDDQETFTRELQMIK